VCLLVVCRQEPFIVGHAILIACAPHMDIDLKLQLQLMRVGRESAVHPQGVS
jgi:hypothetical protein